MSRKLSVSVLYDDELEKEVAQWPQMFREKREKNVFKRNKLKAKKVDVQAEIALAGMRFKDIKALYRKFTEIKAARANGDVIVAGTGDFDLISEVAKSHPRYEEKFQKEGANLKHFEVNEGPQGGNRCFFVVFDDDSKDDFSLKKCIEGLFAPAVAQTEAVEADADAPPTKRAKVADAETESEAQVAPPADC